MKAVRLETNKKRLSWIDEGRDDERREKETFI